MKKTLLLSTTLLLACQEETFIINTSGNEPVYVIEGKISNINIHHSIRVIKSVDFYHIGNSFQVIPNAEVSISDSRTIYLFNYTNDGYFISEQAFAANTEDTYELKVKVEGKVFTAREKIQNIPKIEKMNVSKTFSWNSDNRYSVEIFYTDPKDTEDFYTFYFYKNGTPFSANTGFLYLTDKAFNNENQSEIGYENLMIGDTCSVELHNISSDTYRYQSQLDEIKYNEGTIFEPIASNPRGNIIGGAFGLFQVNGVDTLSLIVKE